MSDTIDRDDKTPKIVIAGVPRSGTRYVFHQLGGKPFRALVGNLIKTHGLAPPDQLSEPLWELVYEALMNDGYKAIFMFGDPVDSVLSTIENIYDGKHFKNCGTGNVKPKNVLISEHDWLHYEEMFDSWMKPHAFPTMCLRYETLPSFAKEFEEFTGVKPDFSNWRERKTNREKSPPTVVKQIEKTYANLISKVKNAYDITIFQPNRITQTRRAKDMETPSDNNTVAFFGPWAGEFGWELMTWQAWCRAEAAKYDKVYCCSYPDMAYLYSDFSTFIPHTFPNRMLEWAKPENIEKIGGYEIPNDVTVQILPHKMYRVPDQQFMQLGGPSYPSQTLKYFIHARGIKRGGKNYPLELWEKLVSLLPPNSVASVGSIKDNWIKGTMNLTGIPLEELCHYLNGAEMVIGQSSGVMHLATLCMAPVLVWGDGRTYFHEPLEVRYRDTWNPFSTPTRFVVDDDWRPNPGLIANLVLGEDRMPKQKGPEPDKQPLEPRGFTILGTGPERGIEKNLDSQLQPIENNPQPPDTVPIQDVPISRVIRDKLAKATSTGRYFITISCLAPDDKLYHFWKTQDFPNSDVFKTLEHVTGECKQKLAKSKTLSSGKVFQWD